MEGLSTVMYYNRDDWRSRENVRVRIKLVEMLTDQFIPMSKVILRYARISGSNCDQVVSSTGAIFHCSFRETQKKVFDAQSEEVA